jgi:hydroxypyruvate reductase
MLNPQTFLRELFDVAVSHVNAENCLPRYLPDPPHGRTVVVGAGKAAAAMAKAVEDHWRGDPARLSGLVVTPYGHGLPTRHIEVIEAAHPVPDAAGVAAAQRILQLVQGLTADDLVLALLSGGGSALLAAPLPGISLQQKREISKALLSSGADIREINCVRKHLSAIKGGRLALASAPAHVVTLAISDVPGDDLSAIASGPTVADPTTCADALDICARYGITLPAAAKDALSDGRSESPKPGNALFAGQIAQVIATPQSALRAAADYASSQGITPLILGDRIEGEAREVARVMAGMVLACAAHGEPVRAPCVLLSGGETTVTVRGNGRGGRNAEFLLALAIALNGAPRIHALAADTDGIDGSEDNAGAQLSPISVSRAQTIGLNPRALLDNNDAYHFFAALDDLIVTGPTRTNINDFRAILLT